MVIDCTAYSTYLNYVKSLLVKLVERYHGEADIRCSYLFLSLPVIFTSGDRLGIYNIKHSVIKVLVLVLAFVHFSVHSTEIISFAHR